MGKVAYKGNQVKWPKPKQDAKNDDHDNNDAIKL